MWKDPILEEIHKHREQRAKKFHYDIDAMFADLRRREAAHPERMVPLAPKPPARTTRRAAVGRGKKQAA